MEGSSTASTCASAPPKSSACSPPSIVIALVPWATMSLSVVSVERWMSSVWTGSTRWKVEEWLLGIFWEWWSKVAQVTGTNLYWIQRLNGWTNRSCRVLTICLHNRLHVVPSLRRGSAACIASGLQYLGQGRFWHRHYGGNVADLRCVCQPCSAKRKSHMVAKVTPTGVVDHHHHHQLLPSSSSSKTSTTRRI